MSNVEKKELITLGAGCFWCIEAAFKELKGVLSVVSGYTGGHDPNPNYESVCAGQTGHAEVAQVAFNPEEISLQDVLKAFWHVHNPTTLNRQGNDVGTQYRSAIFYHSEEQREIAIASKMEHEKEGLWADPFVTEIVSMDVFYPAEDYHQDYLKFNPENPYCQAVVIPKIQKFRKEMSHLLG